MKDTRHTTPHHVVGNHRQHVAVDVAANDRAAGQAARVLGERRLDRDGTGAAHGVQQHVPRLQGRTPQQAVR